MNPFALAIAIIALLAACLIFVLNRRGSSAEVPGIARRGESTEESEAVDEEDPGAAHLQRAWDMLLGRAPRTAPRKKDRSRPARNFYYTAVGRPRRRHQTA